MGKRKGKGWGKFAVTAFQLITKSTESAQCEKGIAISSAEN